MEIKKTSPNRNTFISSSNSVNRKLRCFAFKCIIHKKRWPWNYWFFFFLGRKIKTVIYMLSWEVIGRFINIKKLRLSQQFFLDVVKPEEFFFAFIARWYLKKTPTKKCGCFFLNHFQIQIPKIIKSIVKISKK